MSKVKVNKDILLSNISKQIKKQRVLLGETLQGPTTSESDILKREIIREIIYGKSIERLEWMDAVIAFNTDVMDLKFTLPKNRVYEMDSYEVAETARKYRGRLEWYDLTETFRKESVEVLITDEAKAKQQDSLQLDISMEAASQGLSKAINTEIKDAIMAAIDASMTVAATDEWNLDSGRPAKDLSNVIQKLLEVPSDTSEKDIESGDVVLFYPVGLYGHLSQMQDVKEIIRPFRKLIEDGYNISMKSTKLLSTEAVMIFKGPTVARHYTYNGSDIPTSEVERIAGYGDNYIITKLFKTFVFPESEGSTKNFRIAKITGVL